MDRFRILSGGSRRSRHPSRSRRGRGLRRDDSAHDKRRFLRKVLQFLEDFFGSVLLRATHCMRPGHPQNRETILPTCADCKASRDFDGLAGVASRFGDSDSFRHELVVTARALRARRRCGRLRRWIFHPGDFLEFEQQRVLTGRERSRSIVCLQSTVRKPGQREQMLVRRPSLSCMCRSGCGVS